MAAKGLAVWRLAAVAGLCSFGCLAQAQEAGSMTYAAAAITSIPTLGGWALAGLSLLILLVAARRPSLRGRLMVPLVLVLASGGLLLGQSGWLLAALLANYSLQAPAPGGTSAVEIAGGLLNTYSNDSAIDLEVRSLQLPAACPHTGAGNSCRPGARIVVAGECVIDCRPVTETPPPITSVTLNFFLDDSANQTYEASDGLAYRGSFSFDSTTRALVFDPVFGGPYPLLFDDGPITAGGREPPGAVAGDSIWGATAILETSTATNLEYFAIRGSDGSTTGEFIWDRSNGLLSIPAGATGTIDVPGLVIPAFGETDLLLTIDVSGNGANLAPLFQGNDYTGQVEVSTTALSGELLFNRLTMRDDGLAGDAVAGDGIYSLQLSENFAKHDGLLPSGRLIRYVFILAGDEYKALVGDLAVAQATGTQLFFNGTSAIPGVGGSGDLVAIVP